MKIIQKFKSYVINEINLGRIWQHTQSSTFGIISASRNEASKTENKNNTAKLERLIRSAGYGYVRVKGSYVEGFGTDKAEKVSEDSFLVISDKDDNGKLKGFLKKTANTISTPAQDSVIYKEFEKPAVLIGTSASNSYPSFGKEIVLGAWKPNKIAQFFTALKGGRSFTFESLHYPKPFPSLLMSLKFMPEEDVKEIYTTHYVDENDKE